MGLGCTPLFSITSFLSQSHPFPYFFYTMIQNTSVNSYIQLLHEGKINQMHMEVLQTLSELGSATDTEIARELGYLDINKVRPRRNECVKLGLVHEVGQRECGYTFRKAIVWDLTGVTVVDDRTYSPKNRVKESLLDFKQWKKAEELVFQMNKYQLDKLRLLIDEHYPYADGEKRDDREEEPAIYKEQ